MTIQLNDELLQAAMQANHASDERETIEDALRLLIHLRKQGDTILALKGSAAWEGNLEESRSSRFPD